MTDRFFKRNDPENGTLEMAKTYIEETGCPIFLTGKAGTGKTTFLKHLKTTTAKRMIVTAPTGVAAINAGGVTLHSFFQLPFGPFMPGKNEFFKNKERLFRFSREKKQIIKNLDLLVIDEISMVRADVMDAVDTVLRYHRYNDMAFGGVQLLLIGDLHQLPPVAKSNEWDLLKEVYNSVYFFSSHAIRQIDLIGIELEKVYRQEDDHFIDLLNKVRDGHLDESTAEQLSRQVNPDFKPEEGQGYITLTTHNQSADIINQEKLEAIAEETHELKADISGEFPELIYPTFSQLSLKKGAQIMFLRNDTSIEKRYFNGKIGRIESISSKAVTVSCPGEPEKIIVEPVEWQNIKYSVNEATREIEEETIGRFVQFPIKPAWAITIHKSQGLTFEKAVIDIEAAFAQGQVYVALSRCKTLEGLVLSSPFPARVLRPHNAVYNFLKASGKNADLTSRLGEEKIKYQQQLLIDCFDFQALSNRLGHFFSLLSRHSGLIQVSGAGDLKNIQQSSQKDVIRVGQKFKRQLVQHFSKNTLPEENEYIRERIIKASQWFKPKLESIFVELTQNLKIDTDNKSLGRKLINALNGIRQELGVRQAGILSCGSGFSSSRYLNAVSKAEVEFSPGKPQKKTPVFYEESDISHPLLFQQLKEWRLNLSKNKGIAAFQILHQRVLIQIVVRLPRNTEDLKQIPGVGPKTFSNYGADILEMVSVYCDEKGIDEVILPEKKQTPPKKASPKSPVKKKDTKKTSLDFYRQGLSIKDIAAERGLAQSTILGHLTHYVETGDLEIDTLLSPEKQSSIKKAVSSKTDRSLKSLKTFLGDNYSYGDIKLMMAHLDYQDSTGKN